MAAQRRILSLLVAKFPQNPASRAKSPSGKQGQSYTREGSSARPLGLECMRFDFGYICAGIETKGKNKMMQKVLGCFLLCEVSHRDPIFSADSLFCGYRNFTRRFQTHIKVVSSPAVEPPERNESCSSENNAGETNLVSSSINDESTYTHGVKSNLKVSERHNLAMIFTCKVCDTRSVKTVCRESYDKGIVVARCDGCNNLHLIADRLGWFGEPGSVEEFLAARGEQVKKGSVDTLNLTIEDLAGKKNIEF